MKKNTSITNSVEQVGQALKNLAELLTECFKDIRKNFKTVAKMPIEEYERISNKYEKNLTRHKHNQYTRSTWRINWDTRKHCQVMNNRPVHNVRKVKI